jgi:hypothetical protein
MAPAPDWLIYVQMSERVNWTIMPWQWPDISVWWSDRIRLYWSARAQVDPILQKKHAHDGA